jgi:hypothetical protein
MGIANQHEVAIVFVMVKLKLIAVAGDGLVAYITVTDFRPPVIVRYQP